MAQLLEDSNQSQYQIQGYDSSTIRINNTRYSRPIALSADVCLEDALPANLADLDATHVANILEQVKPEVVLVGTGKSHKLMPDAILAPCIQAQIGFEVMPTAAACRTYTVLSSEGRRVAALLFIS